MARRALHMCARETRDGTTHRLMKKNHYGVLHRSLEAVESKGKSGMYCSKYYLLLFTIHCTVHISGRFLFLDVSGFNFCYGGVRHTVADGSGVKAVA
jgi:hypothetical protein